MSNLKSSSKAALAVLMAGAMGLAGTASAQSYGPQPQRPMGSGIIGCDAPGGRQQAGAQAQWPRTLTVSSRGCCPSRCRGKRRSRARATCAR